MVAWVERHFSKHAIRCAKNFESCPHVLTAITGQPKPKLPTSPSKLLCRGNILHLRVFGWELCLERWDRWAQVRIV